MEDAVGAPPSELAHRQTLGVIHEVNEALMHLELPDPHAEPRAFSRWLERARSRQIEVSQREPLASRELIRAVYALHFERARRALERTHEPSRIDFILESLYQAYRISLGAALVSGRAVDDEALARRGVKSVLRHAYQLDPKLGADLTASFDRLVRARLMDDVDDLIDFTAGQTPIWRRFGRSQRARHLRAAVMAERDRCAEWFVE